jgi:hypothetical protein
VGGARGSHGRGLESVQGFGGKASKERDHLEDPRRRWEDGIRMDLREIDWGGIDWIQLSQDMDRWWSLINTVMNLRSQLVRIILLHTLNFILIIYDIQILVSF